MKNNRQLVEYESQAANSYNRFPIDSDFYGKKKSSTVQVYLSEKIFAFVAVSVPISDIPATYLVKVPEFNKKQLNWYLMLLI